MPAHVNDHCRGHFYVQLYLFILTVLGFHCCVGYPLVAMRRLLTAVASLIEEHGHRAYRLQ